jgi:hypothetical protein
VYSTYDSTEAVIQEMVEECQRKIISEQNSNNDSSIVNEHFKLKIRILQNAPRDPDKLEQLLKEKERESEEVKHIQDIEKLVTEIGILKVIRYLVNRNRDSTRS